MGLFGPSKKELGRQADARKARARKAKEQQARRHARGHLVDDERESSLTIRSGHWDADGRPV